MEQYTDNEQEQLIVEQPIEQVEQIEEQTEPAQEAQKTPEPNSPQERWKKLRQKADLADQYQRERDEYSRMLIEIQNNYQVQQPQQPQEPEFDVSSLDDDDLLTGKELKNVWKKEQSRINKLEQKLQQNERFTHEKAIENELTRKYNDFYDVLNADNIKKLNELRPGLARSLHYNPDLKEKAIETYQAIKDLGIYGASAPQSNQSDHEVVQRNTAKPRSTNSINPQKGNSPLNSANMFANGLTKELKDKLYQEMLEKSGG